MESQRRKKQKAREVRMAEQGVLNLFQALSTEVSQSWLSAERVKALHWDRLPEEDIQAIRELMDLAVSRCKQPA